MLYGLNSGYISSCPGLETGVSVYEAASVLGRSRWRKPAHLPDVTPQTQWSVLARSFSLRRSFVRAGSLHARAKTPGRRPPPQPSPTAREALQPPRNRPKRIPTNTPRVRSPQCLRTTERCLVRCRPRAQAALPPRYPWLTTANSLQVSPQLFRLRAHHITRLQSGRPRLPGRICR